MPHYISHVPAPVCETRSTTNIVKAAQKVINDKDSSTSNAAIRKDMKPMRGTGPSPRVLACADSKAEGKKLFIIISL